MVMSPQRSIEYHCRGINKSINYLSNATEIAKWATLCCRRPQKVMNYASVMLGPIDSRSSPHAPLN